MWILAIVLSVVVIGVIVFFLPMLSAKNRLIVASGNADLSHLRELLDAGGDPNGVGILGMTPLLCAVQNKQHDNVALLLRHGANPKGRLGRVSPLTSAIDENELSLAETLLKAGADPNQPGPFGRSAMADATVEGNVEALRLLFRHGGKIETNWPDEDGIFYQLVFDAAREKRADFAANLCEVTKIYLEHGADPGAKSRRGTTAFDAARHNSALLQILMEHSQHEANPSQGM